MAVDLHTGDTLLPSQFLPHQDHHHDDILSHSQRHDPSTTTTNINNNNNNNNGSTLKPMVHSTRLHTRTDKDDDFIAELTHQMAHFMLQDDDEFDLSGIGSQNLKPSWDLIGSPQSTLWSPSGSKQGSSEGSSQEPSPPATPMNTQHSCWKNTHDMIGMFEKMKLDEKSNSKYHPNPDYETQSLYTSNIGLCSYQSLIQEQIRATELSRLKQEQVLSLKQKLTAYRESQGQISQQYELKEQIQQFQKKGKGSGGIGSGNGRRTHPPRPAPLQQLQNQQQTGSGMRALFLGGSGSRGGTGVFLPRGGTSAPSQSSKKTGKGCATVLIPARVVQALQLHFDQMAATSGPKPGGFPPLHDVLVSNRDGMYSLQKRQSGKAPSNVQNEMILPQEWTY